MNHRENRQSAKIHYSDPTSRRSWSVWGTRDRDAVLTYLVGYGIPMASDTVGGVQRYLLDYDLEEIGNKAWKLTANYGKNPNTYSMTIDFSGGTHKLYQALAATTTLAVGIDAVTTTVTVINDAAFPLSCPFVVIIGTEELNVTAFLGVNTWTVERGHNGTTATAHDATDGVVHNGNLRAYGCLLDEDGPFGRNLPPDFGRAINPTEKGIEGVDIEDDAMSIKITKTFVAASLSGAYLETLFRMKPSKNDAPYSLNYEGQILTFGTANLKFKNFTMNRSGQGQIELTFNLEVSVDIATDDNITIGESAPIEKAGWDHLSVYSEERPDPNNTGRMVKVPVAAYVQRTYKSADFSLLGI